MFEDMLTQITETLGGFVPSLFGALGILVIGWIVPWLRVRSFVAP